MRLFACLSVALSFLFSATLAFALDDYSVNIKVDVTDENSATAREKAINNASQAAVLAAAKRLTDSSGLEQISAMTTNQLINFVKETAVEDEKTSSNRYMANLHLTINMDLLATYMHERQMFVSEQVIPSVIVIPVFSEFNGETPILWEIDNPWRQVWNNISANDKVNIYPIKDTNSNIDIISAQQAWNVDTEKLNKIKDINHVDDVYVTAASYDGIEGLNIDISSLSGYRNNIKVKGVKSSSDELFKDALSQVLPLIEEQATSLSITSASEQNNETTVLFPFAELGDWIAAENKIKSINDVTDLQIQAFSPGKVQFIISYKGDLESLIQALKVSGYLLEDGGNYMVLSYIGD